MTKKKKKKKKLTLRKILKTIWTILEGPLILLLVLIVAGSIFVFLKYGSEIKEFAEYADTSVSESTTDTFKMDETSYIYDSDGNVIATLSANAKSTYQSYSEIPEDAVNAFVAVEDRTFWTNSGVDFKSVIRVSIAYILSSGDDVSGASTITQQLARTVFLSREVSIERKVKEMMIAFRLTRKYSKEKIMEFYINTCNFGNGIYGLEAAAQTYFGCSSDELSLAQITYLCAIPNSPTYYNPYTDATRAVTRQQKILGDMLELGYITEEEYEAALEEEIVIQEKSTTLNPDYNYETTYAIDCAVRYLMELDGFEFRYEFSSDSAYEDYQDAYDEQYELEKTNLYAGGYKIYTSLDSTKQAELQGVLDAELSFETETDSEGVYALQGAMTVIDNDTGKVIAAIGGRTQDYLSTTYGLNRSYQAYRQPGSSIKPLVVYTPAFMQGYTADSIVYNIDVDAAEEEDADISSLTGTAYDIRTAVKQSYNGCAIWLFNEITPEYGLSFLHEMEFDEIVPSDETISAALGGLTNGVNTVQMASAYATLVNDGKYREPTCLVSMLDSDGNEIYEESSAVQVYSKSASAEMIDVLEDVLTSGTASGLKWSSVSDIAAAGKTGTTNDYKDGWFCGATPYYTISVWVGFDTPRTYEGLKGSTYPAYIWKGAMLTLTSDLEAADFDD